MRTSIFAAALLAGAVAQVPSMAAAQYKNMPSASDSNPARITISCYRGPHKTVAWDRPNAVFIDDLRQLGYSYPQAHSIGERVCRDEYGVDDHDHMRGVLVQLLRETPPG